jgi:hypothetical protein
MPALQGYFVELSNRLESRAAGSPFMFVRFNSPSDPQRFAFFRVSIAQRALELFAEKTIGIVMIGKETNHAPR